jgi:hypothetical protein
MASKCVGRQISVPGKRKHVTLITWLGSGESLSVVTALYQVRSLTVYDTKKQKDQLRSLMATSESVKRPFKQDIEMP